MSGTRRTPTLLRLAAAAFLAGAAIGSAVLATGRSSLDWGIASVMFAAMASLLMISASPQARRAGLFLPFSFVGLWAVGYGVASLAWRDPTTDMIMRNGLHLQSESLPVGLAVATVGLLAWAAGYGILRLRLLQAATGALRKWSTRRVNDSEHIRYCLGRIAAVYIVGLGARLILLALGQYSYITTDLQGAITQSSGTGAILSQLEFLTSVGLFLVAYAYFQTGRSSAKWLLGMILVLEIPFGLLSGMRSFILLRLLGVAVTYVVVRRRVPMGASIALLGVITVLTPFTNTYRSEVRDGSGTTVDASGAAELVPTLLNSTFADLSPGDFISGPANFVTHRLRFVDEVAIVTQRTPSEISYIPVSATVLEAVSVLIPRALWAGKPIYTSGLEYARNFWNQPSSAISSRSPTFPGDAYYRGGWLGVVAFMALLGGLMAALTTSLSPRLYPPAVPMFVVAWTELMQLEGSLSLLCAGLAQSLIVTAVAMRWAAARGRGGDLLGSGSVPIGADHQPSLP